MRVGEEATGTDLIGLKDFNFSQSFYFCRQFFTFVKNHMESVPWVIQAPVLHFLPLVCGTTVAGPIKCELALGSQIPLKNNAVSGCQPKKRLSR